MTSPRKPGRTLPRGFYARDVTDVARELLGCHLVHGDLGGRIVEVEAYGGPDDPGSHAVRGPNGRAKIMFGPPGKAYVYFTYGMHFCLNAVTGRDGEASAVLLRAVEPVWGIDAMRDGRALPEHLLASGPGRVCRGLGIGRGLNGADLIRGPLRMAPGDPGAEIHAGTRVGLTSDDGRPWRFWLPSRSLSRP